METRGSTQRERASINLAFAADSSDELAAWARWLDHRQVARSPIRDVYDIGSMFDFADPDGIQIEFFFLDQESSDGPRYIRRRPQRASEPRQICRSGF